MSLNMTRNSMLTKLQKYRSIRNQGYNNTDTDPIQMSITCNFHCTLFFYKPGHDCLLQPRVCSEFPSQLLPVAQPLLLVSVPDPQVTEQDHVVHDDQTTDLFHLLSNCEINELIIQYL